VYKRRYQSISLIERKTTHKNEIYENYTGETILMLKRLFSVKYPELLGSVESDDFIDMTFTIEDLKEVDQVYIFNVKAIHQKKIVGFRVMIDNNITNSFNEELQLVQENVYRNAVRFVRLGMESDQLVSEINKMYGFGDKELRMVDEVSFTAITLHNEPVSLKNDYIKIKIFGNDEEPIIEDLYYESFLNIDLKSKKVEWNEKDIDYREPLIKSIGIEK
jgi:hypothetical protein